MFIFLVVTESVICIVILVSGIDTVPTLKMIDNHESFNVEECLKFWPMIWSKSTTSPIAN